MKLIYFSLLFISLSVLNTATAHLGRLLRTGAIFVVPIAKNTMCQPINVIATKAKTALRDKKAALRFFKKAIGANGLPEKVNMDKSGANKAALESYNEANDVEIEIRQNKYLNNRVEQDHRGIKRITRPMLGFKSFQSARWTLAGIELMRMIKKGQMLVLGDDLSPAEQFYALAL